MKYRHILSELLGVVAAGTLLGACSSASTADNIASVCEARKECDDSNEDEKTMNCADEAARQQKEAETVGCSAQLDEYSACASDVDVCAQSVGLACSSSLIDYLNCHQGYCEGHIGERYCAGGPLDD